MVDSEIGRAGAVYTPTHLAEWMATELLTAAKTSAVGLRTVVDPACGSGELLRAISGLCDEPISMVGIDVDANAVEQCKEALGQDFSGIVGDALDPAISWAPIEPDAVMMNPPWGSLPSRHSKKFKSLGYRLASGQFDAFDLFVERALKVLRPGALLGLILPETVFQAEHQGLRRLLLQHSLLLVARLGEGIFSDVNCGSSLFIVQIGKPQSDHMVSCLQVPAYMRKRIIRGDSTFAEIKRKSIHRVPQSTFACNSGAQFDINRKQSDAVAIAKYKSVEIFDWKKWVEFGRGVEIGKRGSTVRCDKCGFHRPTPSTAIKKAVCSKCGASLRLGLDAIEIVRDSPGDGDWRRLIAGEDVDRYSARPSRWIEWEVPGIRYKPAIGDSPKLLIRKTGLGLRSAVDDKDFAILQTVFYAIARDHQQVWVLDYLQGVINSRPMLAWYLKWSGEVQWRSHPYVTPRALMSLPIPDPIADSAASRISRRISDEAERIRTNRGGSEYVVDRLVCQLYGFAQDDVAWAKGVLSETERHLEYFARMNYWPVIADDSIRPVNR